MISKYTTGFYTTGTEFLSSTDDLCPIPWCIHVFYTKEILKCK